MTFSNSNHNHKTKEMRVHGFSLQLTRKEQRAQGISSNL